MLTHSRSERELGEFFPQPGTPASLGPDRYHRELEWQSPKSYVPPPHISVDNPSNVPFQSLDKRPFQMDKVSQEPGPDAYNVRRAASSPALVEGPLDGPRHVSRSAFRACSPRISVIQHVPGSTEHMAGSILHNPGPGAYSISDAIGTHPISFGNSLPRSAPQDPIGPGHYHKETDLTRRTTNFHSSDSQRHVFEPSVSVDNTMPSPRNPAPSTYYPAVLWRNGVVSSFRSETARGEDYETSSPGPAAYPSEEEGTASFSELESDSLLASSGFRSMSLRKSFTETGIKPFPGPAYYQRDPKAASSFQMSNVRSRSATDVLGTKTFHAVHNPQMKDKLRETGGSPLCGFRSTKERFAQDIEKVEVSGMDGPNGISLSSNLKQRASHFGKHGAFGTSESDKMHHSPFDVAEKCGADPGAFQHVSVELPSATVTHNAFRSSSARLLPDPVEWAQDPSPCHYDQLHQAVYRSQTQTGNTDDVCFGVKQRRFCALPDNGVPGPGGYEPLLAPSSERGLALSSVSRLPPPPKNADASGGVVGPGTYPVKNTWLRKTHNVSSDTACQALQGRIKRFNPRITVPVSPNGNNGRRQLTRGESAPTSAMKPEPKAISPSTELEHIAKWMNKRRASMGQA